MAGGRARAEPELHAGPHKFKRARAASCFPRSLSAAAVMALISPCSPMFARDPWCGATTSDEGVRKHIHKEVSRGASRAARPGETSLYRLTRAKANPSGRRQGLGLNFAFRTRNWWPEVGIAASNRRIRRCQNPG